MHPEEFRRSGLPALFAQVFFTDELVKCGKVGGRTLGEPQPFWMGSYGGMFCKVTADHVAHDVGQVEHFVASEGARQVVTRSGSLLTGFTRHAAHSNGPNVVDLSGVRPRVDYPVSVDTALRNG